MASATERKRKDMLVRPKKLVLSGMILFLLLVACDSAGGNANSTQQQSAKPLATTPPRLVTPKAASGSPGIGPRVISSVTAVPGGKAGSEQIILGDRTLIISNSSKQNGASPNTTLISLSLIVQNIGAKAIKNQPTFFQLIGTEGDTFGYQYNSSDNFYGVIAAHTARNGTIVFQLPTAAVSHLYLLYRPEVATETAIILLRIT